MIEVLSTKNMRASDKHTIENKTPSLVLMKNAAMGIYKNIPFDKFECPKTLIVCGTGNNAGDGYALALILKEKSHPVSLLLIEERFSKDGEYYFEKCKQEGIDYSLYTSDTQLNADIIVDCIFGTGFRGEPLGAYKEVIEKINTLGAYVISADINSGLNGDSGLGKGAIKSDLTVSIGSYKSGHFLGMAKDKIGNLVNEDIGILPIEPPYYLFEKSDAVSLLEKRNEYSHKGTYGYITLIGGSYEFSGAIKLANIAGSAMRAGAGVVRIATPKSIGTAVMPYLLESTLYPLSEIDGAIKLDKNEIDIALRGTRATAIGMGLNTRGENEKLLDYILSSYDGNVLLDADALNTVSSMGDEILKNAKGRIVLTPHLKELERLTNVPIKEIEKDPVIVAKEYAEKTGAVVLLKGTTTIVTDGERVVFIDTGCAGMATAGSGDVLSGVIASLLGQHPDKVLEMVCLGAYINGVAGMLACKEETDISMVASDTARNISNAIKEILKGEDR